MERQKKVIDASIAVKWFVNEDDSNKALEIRNSHINGDITLVVPEIMFLEVLNALRYKKLDKESLNNVNTDLFGMQLHLEKTSEFILEKAIQIALNYDLTIYDALYASIAQIHGCPLVTVDEKLKKFPSAVSL